MSTASRSTLRSANIALQNMLQPQMRSLYVRACEALPAPLIMSSKYFEAKKLLESPQVGDEFEESTNRAQRELISRTLKNALLSVPYYRRNVKIDSSAVKPENAMEVLDKFPFISKQDIMNNPNDFLSRNLKNRFLIYSTTGGSTGKGVGLWKRLEEYHVAWAFIGDMWGRFGYTARSKVLRIGSDGIAPLDKPPCRVNGRRLMVSPRHLSEKWLPEIVSEIERFRPDFIHSYPSCLEVIASHLRENARGLKVKGIFLASEEVKKEQLDYFNGIFGAPICFHYGSGENVLLGYGCYDGERVCYHFHPLYGFVENLKDDYGYELVGTSFWNQAMPLIRYRTEDYGKLSDELKECELCGRSWKTACQLDGRRQYFLTTKHGSKFAGLSISCGVDKFIWDHVSNFQFVQNRPGEIELHVIPRNSLTAEAEARILDAQRKRLAEWFDPITLVKRSEIPVTSGGKRRLVVVNIDQDPRND